MTEKEKPINWNDQIAHFASCFFLTLLTMGSWFGLIVVILWAITREYYQTKGKMEDAAREHDLKHKVNFKFVIEYMWSEDEASTKENDFIKRDLLFSYAGIAAAYMLIVVPLNIWVF